MLPMKSPLGTAIYDISWKRCFSTIKLYMHENVCMNVSRMDRALPEISKSCMLSSSKGCCHVMHWDVVPLSWQQTQALLYMCCF